MALTTSEVTKIKAELGYNVLDAGAEPYISVVAIFEQVIQPFLLSGAITTSSTTVAAASSPTPVTLTLASASGVAAYNTAVVDVDSRKERATIQSISGSDITLLLSKAHTGTYPVVIEGGESLVRDILDKIDAVKEQMSTNYGAGALKKVDEIEFYGAGNMTYFGTLGENLRFWRDQLAGILGVPSMWERKNSAGSRMSMY